MYKVISTSGGKSSALMLLIERARGSQFEAIFCNTGFEHFKTLEFIHNIETLCNIPITWLEYESKKVPFKVVNFETANRSGQPFINLCAERKYLPNRVARFCTSELKVRCIKKYLKSKGIDNYIASIGIRYDEPHRYDNLLRNQSKDVFDYEFPLYDLLIDKLTVNEFWKRQAFTLEIPSYLGNCTLCFNKGKKNMIKAIQSNESHTQEFSDLEKCHNSSFSKRYSISQLEEMSHQTLLFSPLEELDVQCHCNID